MNFLFWNIHKNKKTFPVICSLVISKDIDVLLLAEYPMDVPIDLLLCEIEKNGVKLFLHISACPYKEKIIIMSRFRNLIEDKADMPGVSAKRVKSIECLSNEEISLIICHLPSKVNKSNTNQSENAEDIRLFIESIEEEIGHKRTIICGDFNMNPFDDGMTKARGFHAVMDKGIALRKNRKIGGRIYSYFYNPMWGFLGDLGRGGAPGTMYYNSSDHINLYWHIYDQVLIRPDLIANFNDEYLDVITKVNTTNLIARGWINKKYSDHLPISFSLNI